MSRSGLRSIVLSITMLLSVGGIGIGSAQAGGGAAPTVQALLKDSVLASARMGSVHMRGSANAKLTEQTGGVSIGLKGVAFFRGDFADQPKVAFHGQGQLRALGEVEGLRFVGTNQEVAGKAGNSQWSCVTAGSISSSSPSMLPPAELKYIRVFELSLARQVRYADLGSTVYEGKPSWHLQTRLVTRLDLAPLYAILAEEMSSVKKAVTIPRIQQPWIHVKANFWINQLNYTLQKVTLFIKVRTKRETVQLMLGDKLSHYGEAGHRDFAQPLHLSATIFLRCAIERMELNRC